MKKLKISNQLFIIVTCVILFVSSCFTLLVYSCVRLVIEDEIYSRLQSDTAFIELNPGSVIPDNSFRIGYYTTSTKNKSYDVDSYVNDEELESILNGGSTTNKPNQGIMVDKPSTNSRKGTFVNSRKLKIYYYYSIDNDGEISIMFTDDSYLKFILKDILFKLLFIYFIFILITSLVVIFWSNKFVRRIQTLQTHILDLPKEKYEVSYVDDSFDEIGDLSRSVEKMRLEICQNEKTKQEMLQNISHDFKTPIAVIKSYAEAYQDGMADESSAKIIITQADLLKKKVNRLLQFNSLEYLKKDKEFEEIDMNELVDVVVENYKYQTDLKFEVDKEDDVKFLGYTENFYTVVENIIDNAKRYAKTTIRIVLRKNRLRIYNDGEPIDEQFISSVFKPYEKGSKGEFGLGMSIVQRTLDFFNYELKVVNENVGVSFIIEKREDK